MKKKKYQSLEYEIEEYLYDVVTTSAFSFEDNFDDESDDFWD